jgi:peptidyl-tRNA hydrolase
MGVCGPDFMRLRFGIGRPVHRSDVPAYVLDRFGEQEDTEPLVTQAADMIRIYIDTQI